MRRSGFLCLGLTSLALGLLEEVIVSFESTESSVSLHDASIVYSDDDPVGVEIVATNLADDFEAITGTRPSLFKVSVECADCADNAIIAATANSSLARAMRDDGRLDVSAVAGKWESYQTNVMDDPIPGIKKALVIVGSDKRGVMYGLLTLSEQSGQSPYVLFLLQEPLSRFIRD